MNSSHQSRRWLFTTNNPDHQAYAKLHALGPEVTYLIFSDEVAPTTGTPHLQGYVVFKTNFRFRAAKSKLPAGSHVTKANGTSEENRDYCTKDGSTNTVVYGSIPNVVGRTNRYDEFYSWVLEQPTKPTPEQVARQFPSIFLTNSRTQTFIDLVYPTASSDPGTLRDYQSELLLLLSGEPDPRTVIFVVDPVGNSGKSYFARKLFRSRPDDVQILSSGRREDIAYAIDERKSVFLFDLPRSTSEFLQYAILEQLKDGLIFSNKYMSQMKVLSTETSHVVVFMNEYPDMTKLSADRYKIIVWNYEN